MIEVEMKPQTPRTLLAQLSEMFPVFQNAVPLAVGIHKAIRKRLPEIDQRLLRIAMKIHTDSTRYLKALANGRNRHDLDGQPSGTITPDQRALAASVMRERSHKAAERRRMDNEARERQEKLLKLAEKFNSR